MVTFISKALPLAPISIPAFNLSPLATTSKSGSPLSKIEVPAIKVTLALPAFSPPNLNMPVFASYLILPSLVVAAFAPLSIVKLAAAKT